MHAAARTSSFGRTCSSRTRLHRRGRAAGVVINAESPGGSERIKMAPRHFGILVPSTNTTCEIEFCRLPPELQVHTGRLGKGSNTPFSPSKDDDVAYQAKLLGEATVESIALAQTWASLLADDYDE